MDGKRERVIYRAICCSRSWICARFEVFLGFGLGACGGGVESLCQFNKYRIVSTSPAVKHKYVLC